MRTIHFKVCICGLNIDRVVTGATDEDIVTALRAYIACRIPGLFFGALKAQIQPGGKCSWTDQEFFQRITDYYNKDTRKCIQPPVTASQFIALTESLGMATEVKESGVVSRES